MSMFIKVTMILLILSMITEKLSNLLKVHFPKIFKKELGKTSTKRMQLLTVVIGTFIAVITNSDIFQMYSSDEIQGFWDTKDFGPVFTLTSIVGYLITGFFLSFGSKFFHDLLDLLLQAKDLKRSFVQKEAWNFQDIDDVVGFLEEKEMKQMDLWLKTYFQNFAEVKYFQLDSVANKVDVILRSSVEGLPDTIPYRTSSGKKLQLAISKTVRD